MLDMVLGEAAVASGDDKPLGQPRLAGPRLEPPVVHQERPIEEPSRRVVVRRHDARGAASQASRIAVSTASVIRSLMTRGLVHGHRPRA